MTKIAFKGKPVSTIGELPAVGSRPPKFTLVNRNLEDVALDSFGQKKKVLNIFPSLDTGVCASTVRNFYKFCHEKKDIVVLNISMDLPFASARFCEAEKLDNCVALSAFRSSFPKDYGVAITDGPLRGLCSRAVVILDVDNTVIYHEQVPEITQEPSYEQAMKILR